MSRERKREREQKKARGRDSERKRATAKQRDTKRKNEKIIGLICRTVAQSLVTIHEQISS